MSKRPIFNELYKRLREPHKAIQALLGPRQVGKTTLALQAQQALDYPIHYVTADTATLESLSWIEGEWEVARNLTQGKSTEALLIIDEAQKIPNWSNLVKKLWDEDTRTKTPLKVVLLGSSPWLMQKGLTESLYPNKLKNWIFGCAKAPKFAYLK